MSGAMLADLAEVVRLGLLASDDEPWSVDQDGDVICNGEEVAWPVSNKLDAPYIAALNNWFRTHHTQITRDAEDAAKFNYLITMLPVGTFNDRDVSDRQSCAADIDAAMKSANGGDVVG